MPCMAARRAAVDANTALAFCGRCLQRLMPSSSRHATAMRRPWLPPAPAARASRYVEPLRGKAAAGKMPRRANEIQHHTRMMMIDDRARTSPPPVRPRPKIDSADIDHHHPMMTDRHRHATPTPGGVFGISGIILPVAAITYGTTEIAAGRGQWLQE